MENSSSVCDNPEASAKYQSLLSKVSQFIKGPSFSVNIPQEIIELNASINTMINNNTLPQLQLKNDIDLDYSYQALSYFVQFINIINKFYANEKNLENKDIFDGLVKFLYYYIKNFNLQTKIDTSDYSDKLAITKLIIYFALQRCNKCAYQTALSQGQLMCHKHIVISIFKHFYKINTFCDDFLQALSHSNIQFTLNELIGMLRYIQYYQSCQQNKEIIIPLSKLILAKVTFEKQSNDYLDGIKVLKKCLFQNVEGFLETIFIKMIDCIIQEETNISLIKEIIMNYYDIVCPVLEERHINFIVKNFKIENSFNFFLKILSYLPQYIKNVVNENNNNDCARLVSALQKKITNVDTAIVHKFKYHQKYGFCLSKYKDYKDINLNILLDFTFDDEELFNILLSILMKDSTSTNDLMKMLSESYQRIIPITRKNYKILERNYMDTVLQSGQITFKVNDFDQFKPYSSKAFTIDEDNTNVEMIDKTNYLIHLDQMKGSLCSSLRVGIDTEWKSSTNGFETNNPVSIIQLSSFDEKFIYIIDLYTGLNDRAYMQVITDLMRKLKFVGFGFNTSDLKLLPSEFSSVFKDNLEDIQNIYKEKNKEKVNASVPSLKNVVKEILNVNMCKVEQCSNWNRRPLRRAQIHYAAVDALMCVKLYKALNII